MSRCELYELLDRRVRELGYVDCDELVEWLQLVRDVDWRFADVVVAAWANGERASSEAVMAEVSMKTIYSFLDARAEECGYIDYEELAQWLMDELDTGPFDSAFDVVAAWGADRERAED